MKIDPGFSGYFLFLASFQAKKLLRAHLVFLSVLTGTTPLDRIASSSSSTKVEKRSRVELVFEPVVWVWDPDAELLLASGCGSCRSASSTSRLGVVSARRSVDEFAWRPGQSVQSRIPRQNLSNEQACIHLSLIHI